MHTHLALGMARPRDEEQDADVPDHLKCGVCLDAPAGRVEQCGNGHLICADGSDSCCLARLRSSAADRGEGVKCPTCRQELPRVLGRSLVAEQAIAALPARCRHCSQEVLRGDLSAHETACPRRELVCSGEGCSWRGLQEDVTGHEAICMRGMALCSFEELCSCLLYHCVCSEERRP